MDEPSKDFRENPSRAVYIAGEIDQSLVNKLTPDIVRLRNESSDPITAYIDSGGGEVNAAILLRDLIRTPNQDGKRTKLITVVTGMAGSSAADLLALGDYAIAYPHSNIVYHGTRHIAAAGLTMEGASSLAQRLQYTNELFAANLSTSTFRRFVFRLQFLADEFKNYANQPKDAQQSPDIEPLIKALYGKISPEASNLAINAINRQKEIAQLSMAVNRHLKTLKKKRDDPCEFEIEVLKGILKHRKRNFKRENRLLSSGGLFDIAADFQILWDFHCGGHQMLVDGWICTYGRRFLSTDEIKEHDAFPPGRRTEQVAWLKDHTHLKIRLLWYFTVSMCRMLQTSEFRLTPEDAYWLGLINEVTGRPNLPNERMMIESKPRETKNRS